MYEKTVKGSHQTAKLDRLVEQLVVDDALFGVGRFPGQLDAGVCDPANFEFPRLAWDWGRHSAGNIIIQIHIII